MLPADSTYGGGTTTTKPPNTTTQPANAQVGQAVPTTAGLMGAASTQVASAPNTSFTPAQASTTYYNPATATATGYNAATGTAQTYDPTKVDRTGTTYDPTQQTVQGNQLVSNQLNDLTAGNSKYIQQARQQGTQQAARSGLMTSSIAAGSAERAAVSAALPIAQADAARYGQVADANQTASNTAKQFNAGQTLTSSVTDANATNTASQFNTGQKNQMTQANNDATNRASEFGANAQNTNSQFNANSINQAGAFNAGSANTNSQFNAGQTNSGLMGQAQLAQQGYQFDRSLNAQQSNQYFGSQYQREQQMSQVLTSIYNNPNLTPAQQQQAADNAKTIFQGLWNATNTTFAAGVPQVFTNV